MENKESRIVTGIYRSGMINTIISNSYITFFCSIILGVVFDTITPIKIFNNLIFEYVGFAMVVLGPILIYWAQKSSDTAKKNALNKGLPTSFEYGPYRYTRNPSYLGVFIMIMGFGLVLNSIFSIIFGLIAYFIIRFIFLKKEEKLLEGKYGQIYFDYKNKVKNRL